MRVLLQQPPSGKEAPRYVQLSLVPDLLGGWELLRESGQTGGRIQLRRELFLQHDDAIHAFEKACGKKLPYVIDPRRPGDIAECYADPTKAKKELGWVAEYGIEEMCADSWNWQQKNPDGYHTVK